MPLFKLKPVFFCKMQNLCTEKFRFFRTNYVLLTQLPFPDQLARFSVFFSRFYVLLWKVPGFSGSAKVNCLVPATHAPAEPQQMRAKVDSIPNNRAHSSRCVIAPPTEESEITAFPHQSAQWRRRRSRLRASGVTEQRDRASRE